MDLRLLLLAVYLNCMHVHIAAVDDAEFEMIKKRLEMLENNEQKSSTIIQQLQEDLKAKEVIIADLTTRIILIEKEHTNDSPSGQVIPEQSIVSAKHHIAAKNGENTSAFFNRSTPSPVLKNLSRDLPKRLIVDPEVPVAFNAVVSPASVNQIGHGQNIVFDKVLLNLGAGYHSQHGIFIAPTSGLYLFSATIMSYVDPTPEFQAEIVKNGQLLGRVFTHGDNHREDQGSMTVITQLQAADEVWLRQLSGARFYGDYYSSFAGLLLSPM